jgi:hypothetical protein
MNEKRVPEGSDEALARLLRAAGPRVMPHADRTARARSAVHGEWQAVLAARRARRWRWLTAAVVAIVAFGLGLFAALRPAPPIAVATVVRVSGEVMRRVERRRPPEALVSGVTLRVGESIETSAGGRALVRWSDSTVLRFDSGSSARLDSADKLRLARGTVYVETHSEAQGLAFQTPLGEVRHLGTRFEVRVEPDNVRVRVRDGLAIFASNDFAPVIVEAGRQLVVAGGSASLQPGPDASDPEWRWTQSISPTFAIEGRSLFDAVEWLAHEAGLRVIYASPAVREHTRGVILHGSIEGLDLEQALAAVLSGSGATFELRRDRIEIREAGPR